MYSTALDHVIVQTSVSSRQTESVGVKIILQFMALRNSAFACTDFKNSW